MAEIVLFHHAQGLTTGIRAFAATLEGAGHTVHTPDLYEGNVYATLDEGLAYAKSTGFDQIIERGRVSAEGLPDDLVYAGFSLGVLPAQLLAQTRPGARGALLLEGCVPPSEFGDGWPAAVPVQIHGMDADEFFAGEDLETAQALVASTPAAQLFLYPGKQHLFADNSLASYDEKAATLMTDRVLAFLAG